MLNDKELKEYNKKLKEEYQAIYNRYIKHNKKKLKDYEIRNGLDKVKEEYKSLLNNPTKFYDPQPEHRPIYNLVYAVLGLSLWDEDEYKKHYELSTEYFEANKSYRDYRLNELNKELKPLKEYTKELNNNALIVKEEGQKEIKRKINNKNKM